MSTAVATPIAARTDAINAPIVLACRGAPGSIVSKIYHAITAMNTA